MAKPKVRARSKPATAKSAKRGVKASATAKVAPPKRSTKPTTSKRAATAARIAPQRKPTTKAASKSKPKVVKARAVIEAARKLGDPRVRADFLEAQLAVVSDARKLIDPLGEALYELSGNEVGRRLYAIALRMRDHAGLLDQLGEELYLRWCPSEALSVFRLAIEAGSKNAYTRDTLGHLLAMRGDPGCVSLLEHAIASGEDTARISLALYFLERDPARALEVLAPLVDDGQADELRSMLHAAAGRTRAAEAALAAALEDHGGKLAGHLALCEWHSGEDRYDRALFHARALFELRQAAGVPASRRAEVDEAIVHAFHRGRAFAEIVPWVVELCAHEVPPAIAWDVFHGLEAGQHPELAIRAAEAYVAQHPEEGPVWQVEIASVRSSKTDVGPLAAVAVELGDTADGWVALANAYHTHGANDAASAAIDRALELDPSSIGALTAMYDLALHAGDLALMERAARAVATADPHGHEGCERLGRLWSRRGDGAAALELANRAVQLAPYCHNAWLGLGEAQLVVGDLVRAKEAVTRSAAISKPDRGGHAAVLIAALGGEPAALEAELATAHGHLPAPPFPAFLAALRGACAGSV